MAFLFKIKSFSFSMLIFLTKSNDWSKNNAIALKLSSLVLRGSTCLQNQRWNVPEFSWAHPLYTPPFTPTRVCMVLQGVIISSDNSRVKLKAFHFDPLSSSDSFMAISHPGQESRDSELCLMALLQSYTFFIKQITKLSGTAQVCLPEKILFTSVTWRNLMKLLLINC